MTEQNKMKEIRIEKVVLNVGCGVTTNIDNAKKVLEQLSGRKIKISKTKKRSTFNVPKGKPMGCVVTIREGTHDLIKRLLKAKNNSLNASSFDNKGNFAFGIPEYIDVPGMEYDPKIGIIGFDVCITLERPGYRVKKKKINRKVGKSHVITKEESQKFAQEMFGIKLLEQRKHEE
ncbi:MAG: 50S ribosomal protein L5 [Candidatus Aenigmarchaeota archaeon]|nr:50S ribosomal protein L5 [Candidatus Aenigmarchaeota archaeon]